MLMRIIKYSERSLRAGFAWKGILTALTLSRHQCRKPGELSSNANQMEQMKSVGEHPKQTRPTESKANNTRQ